MTHKLEDIITKYNSVSSIRDRRLFSDFLVKGYRQTTLSSVPSKILDEVVFAKVCLGMIITLYDDLADNPQYYNPKLLKELYRLNINQIQPPVTLVEAKDIEIYTLSCELFSQLEITLQNFCHYTPLVPFLAFDIRHIFLANQYAEIMTMSPNFRNLSESKMFGPYNMGMVAAGMIDLMASSSFNLKEMGSIRELLIKGQRLGRIGNIVSTYEREISEGDVTNEIMIHPDGPVHYKKILMEELHIGLIDLKKNEHQIESFDVNSYSEGLGSLFNLHVQMKGII